MEYLAPILPVNTFVLHTVTRASFGCVLANIHARIFIKADGTRSYFASARAVRKSVLSALSIDIFIVRKSITIV
jgi:hypothetical protein